MSMSSICRGDKVYFFVEDDYSNVFLREDIVANIYCEGDDFFIITSCYGLSLNMEDRGELWDTNKKSLLKGEGVNEN